MRNQPVPLVTGFYADQDRPFSQQDVWNYLPCRAEKQGARSPLMLKTPPGLYPWLELEGAPPVRGMHDCEGRMFAVIGTTLYRLSPNGVAAPIGTIPGNGRVSMDHNQRANGQQLTVVNGSAGYVYDTHTEVFERITDSGFPGSPIVRFMDGYMLGLDPAGRFAFSSGAANALDYNTLDRWTSEYRPDRLVGMGRLGGELLLLSANSGEFFGNTGAAQQPFRSKRIFLDKGCAGPHTVVEADNTVFWLGSDGYFYQLDGYNSRRISTRPIEQAIRGQDWWNAFAFVWESEGHTVVYWTFLDGQTWGWDTSQQEWHRRESYGLDRWRPSCTARSNGAWYAGDFQKGRIWRLDWGYPWEGDTEFVSGFTLPVIHDNQNELVHSRLELVMDVGALAVDAGQFAEHPPIPTISGNAPDGVKGVAFEYAYTASGGTGDLAFSVSAGQLPSGVTLSASGVLAGTPVMSGNYTFTVRVTDENGLWAEVADGIAIAGGIVALATNTYLFERSGAGLVETVPIGIPVAERNLAISPNGALIACGHAIGPFLRVGKLKADRSGYVELPIDTQPGNPVGGVDFHPSGSWLVVAVAGNHTLAVYRVEGDGVLLAGTAPLNQAGGPRFSPDGRWIVCGCGIDPPRRGIGVLPFDPETGEIGSPIHPGVSGGVEQASPYSAWSPDGKFIAACNNNALVIWGFNGTSLTLQQSQAGVSGIPASGRGAHWSADGRYLYTVDQTAYGGHRVAAYEWNGSSLSSPVYPAEEPAWAVFNDSSISSDGAQLVIGGSSGGAGSSIFIYDLSGTLMTKAPDVETSSPTTRAVRWTGVPID